MAKLIQIMTIALALCVGVGFFAVYSWEITKAWTHGCPTPKSQGTGLETLAATTNSITEQAEEIKDPYTYVATILVGLISGVVAVLFGQKISLSVTGWREILSGVYAIAYMSMGVASVITWMLRPCESVLVKTLALSFLGLLVPVVTSFFKNNSFSEVMGWKKT